MRLLIENVKEHDNTIALVRCDMNEISKDYNVSTLGAMGTRFDSKRYESRKNKAGGCNKGGGSVFERIIKRY